MEPTKVLPTEVIVISSDEESVEKKEIVIVVSSDEECAEKKEIQDVKGKKIREKSPRKNPKTLTSVLLARSEVCHFFGFLIILLVFSSRLERGLIVGTNCVNLGCFWTKEFDSEH